MKYALIWKPNTLLKSGSSSVTVWPTRMEHKMSETLLALVAGGVQSSFPYSNAKVPWSNENNFLRNFRELPVFRTIGEEWRRGRDSNPRDAFGAYSLSRGAPSTTRPPLHRRGYARFFGASTPSLSQMSLRFDGVCAYLTCFEYLKE